MRPWSADLRRPGRVVNASDCPCVAARMQINRGGAVRDPPRARGAHDDRRRRAASGQSIRVGQVRVTQLDDGRLRLFGGSPIPTIGIYGLVSSDEGLTWTLEDGMRIATGSGGSGLSVVRTHDGRWRGYYSTGTCPGSSCGQIFSATSTDLLNWSRHEARRHGGAARLASRMNRASARTRSGAAVNRGSPWPGRRCGEVAGARDSAQARSRAPHIDAIVIRPMSDYNSGAIADRAGSEHRPYVGRPALEGRRHSSRKERRP